MLLHFHYLLLNSWIVSSTEQMPFYKFAHPMHREWFPKGLQFQWANDHTLLFKSTESKCHSKRLETLISFQFDHIAHLHTRKSVRSNCTYSWWIHLHFLSFGNQVGEEFHKILAQKHLLQIKGRLQSFNQAINQNLSPYSFFAAFSAHFIEQNWEDLSTI